jgi:EmrB/QacA subfamily drug resistance transporter
MSVTQRAVFEKSATHPNVILAICCMSLLLVGLDVTRVNVALPAIQKDLHATMSDLQWIVDAYTIVVASLLMFAGSMSDHYGRRRVFQIGLCLFTFGSLLCSLAPGRKGLIEFRALQGLGASMLNPVALSIIANAFSSAKDRARAIGIWGAVSGVSLALGPLLGGALTETIGWRAIFWVNVPIGIAAVILAAKFIPESKSSHARAFDPVGQILIFCFLASLTYSVIEAPNVGWNSPGILGLFAFSAILLAAFLRYEWQTKEPLLELRFFRSIPFSSAAVTALCAFASFAAFLFLNAIYLQQQRGLSALDTGLYTLPIALVLMVSAPLSGRLVGSYGSRPSLLVAGAGFLCSAVLLRDLSVQTPAWVLMLSYLSFGLGLGMVNPAITNSAVAGMPLSRAGVAAAIASTGRQVGAALGVAVAGTVVSSHHARGVDFARATQPIWWGMSGCGALIFGVGWLSSTPWAKRSIERVTHLFDHTDGRSESTTSDRGRARA